jgi:hypothetical protein
MNKKKSFTNSRELAGSAFTPNATRPLLMVQDPSSREGEERRSKQFSSSFTYSQKQTDSKTYVKGVPSILEESEFNTARSNSKMYSPVKGNREEESVFEDDEKPRKKSKAYRKTLDQTIKSTDDITSGFHSNEKPRKRGSSEGSDDDTKSEQDQYFQNEEKHIKNHLRLNTILQIISIVIYLLAMVAFDWTHISISQEGDTETSKLSEEYHISLLKMSPGFDMENSIYLFTLTNKCLE